MAYRLRQSKSVQTSLRKVANEQIDKAIGEINDEEFDAHETVHQVRKRCKKLRGLIRLVRPVFDDYSHENTCFRDAARELSDIRDAQSLLECLDDLRSYYERPLEDTAFSGIQHQLVQNRDRKAEESGELDEKLDEFLYTMQEAKERVVGWTIDEEGFEAVEGGLKKTYRRARDAMDKAFAKPSSERFHEWRKRVKYHWYHTRLLRRIWEKPMKAHRHAAHDLSNLLGDDHDLAILHATVLEHDDWFDEEESQQALLGLIDRRRRELESQAQPLGQKLLAEKPSQLADRWEAYWNTWRAA